jgi:hypothetical protein
MSCLYQDDIILQMGRLFVSVITGLNDLLICENISFKNILNQFKFKIKINLNLRNPMSISG